MKSKLDIVYTWVNDRQPGYLENLNHYADADVDRNPNRTRDNLELLKYSIRSLEKYTDWYNKIFLFTCRPQIPDWINTKHNNLQIIHHDEIIDNEYLPTYNSFCIISYLASLEGTSDPFIYMEDDMLFANETPFSNFLSNDNKIILYPRIEITTPGDRQHDSNQPPWNMALSYSNHLLDCRYGNHKRQSVNRVPILIYKESWLEMLSIWNKEFTYTRQSKFRKLYNVAPEFIYLYFMLHENRGELSSYYDTYTRSFYYGLDNNNLLAKAAVFAIECINPHFVCLNDNFGDVPDTRVEDTVKRYLNNNYPEKSLFEL